MHHLAVQQLHSSTCNCFNQANIGTVPVYFNQEREKEEKQCKKVAADMSLKKKQDRPIVCINQANIGTVSKAILGKF